ncbi:MAG: Asp-tRNA(Asn)/Glu-tRNA(Gln) amidotransferase subunit GatA, partial [Fidelibacterota bacterium]
ISINENALEDARRIQRKMDSGKAGRLAGKIFSVKDIICVKDQVTTCGSNILNNFVSPYNATAVELILREDALIIGKTNLDEFAMGSSNENSFFGPVKNPYDNSRVPGGSSGGSCAAVAAGLSDISLGTDTGGSIRQPAAFCGVVGLKPTYGRVSRYGLVAFASSLDQIGPISGNVSDCALTLEVISGHDPLDSTSVDLPVKSHLESLKEGIDGLKIGLPREYFGEGLNHEVKEVIDNTVQMLKLKGAVVENICLPHTEYAIATYYILATAEASSNLARYDGIRYGYEFPGMDDLDAKYMENRSRGFGPEVKRRIILGTYVLSAGYYEAYYQKAQKVRRLIKNDFNEAFEKIHCIIAPTTPTTAFKLGSKIANPLEMYLSDIYTVPVNLAGLPAVNVPIGLSSENLPIGLQIIGPPFKEDIILRVARAIEELIQFKNILNQ